MSAASALDEPAIVIDSAAEPGAQAKSGRKKRLLVVGLVVVLLAGGFVFMKPSTAEEHAAPVPGEVVDVGQMTVNLADAGRFARVSFSLVLVEGAGAEAVRAKYPLLKEAVLFEVSKVSAEQLRAPGGLDAISAALSERARGVYPDGEVLRVVLTELLVQ